MINTEKNTKIISSPIPLEQFFRGIRFKILIEAALIKIKREELGLSPEEIARRAGVPESTVQEAEEGIFPRRIYRRSRK